MGWTAEKIRQCREAKSWTQDELARRAGVGARSVTAWESGEVTPRKSAQAKLTRLFGPPDGPTAVNDRVELRGYTLAQLAALQGAVTAELVFRAEESERAGEVARASERPGWESAGRPMVPRPGKPAANTPESHPSGA